MNNGSANTKTVSYASTSTASTIASALYSAITAVHYYFADHLGSADVVTSAAGAIEQESDYYPFGGERAITAGPNNYKFTGKERDGESGLDYFAARYFGSGLGRLTTPDPEQAAGFDHMGDPQSWNGYSYARNNPLLYTDPDGENYHVCDENGGNCSEQTDKDFNQNRKNAQANGEIWKDGKIWLPNGNGGFDYKGSYVQTDVDIPGDPEANRNAAAMIGSGEDFVIAFMYRSTRDGITGGVFGVALGELADGLMEGLSAARATQAVEETVDVASLSPKIARQMVTRGWTKQEILDTVANGKAFSVVNKGTGGPATEYVGAGGRFVVVDDTTKQVIQVSGPGFLPNHLVQP